MSLPASWFCLCIIWLPSSRDDMPEVLMALVSRLSSLAFLLQKTMFQVICLASEDFCALDVFSQSSNIEMTQQKAHHCLIPSCWASVVALWILLGRLSRLQSYRSTFSLRFLAALSFACFCITAASSSSCTNSFAAVAACFSASLVTLLGALLWGFCFWCLPYQTQVSVS